MLNITQNSISGLNQLSDYNSFKILKKNNISKVRVWLLTGLLLAILVFLFLPWTQNINAKGYVTTRSPEQRPQSIQSVIDGRLEKWYVQEGDFVAKGDTIVFISEVKSDYFDPQLIERTSEQIDAKTSSNISYNQKIGALKNQLTALKEGFQLKRAQTKNKVLQAKNYISIDSIDLIAYQTNLKIDINQLTRTKELYEKGLKSLTELQEKEYKLQSSQAKVDVQKNKLLNQKNALINLQIELLSIEKEYDDKIAKSQSDQQTAFSDKFENVVQTSKLQNQLSNYSERQKLYYITAPQSGYITKAIKKGIGETIKEGTDIATIMPSKYDLAIEVYMKPQDMPLLSLGNDVRLRFDGWPAIVISGWPEKSTGIFSGKIVAIDRFISDNGYYRILISPYQTGKEWPENLMIGTGTQAFVLLKDVPIWYEIWRQLNGFPSDFYKGPVERNDDLKRKAPIKSIK